MSLDCTPSSDWDGWTPPDNMDRISDIPTISSDQDIADLACALADADAPPQARRARKSRKRNIPRKARRRAPKKDLGALSTMATVNGPVSSRKKKNQAPLEKPQQKRRPMVGQTSHARQSHLQDHVGQSTPRPIVKTTTTLTKRH